MTAETQLYTALLRIARQHDGYLDDSPAAQIVIPMKGGQQLSIPVLLLAASE